MTEKITKEFVISHTLMDCLNEFTGAPNDPDRLKKYIEEHSLEGFREELLKKFDEDKQLYKKKEVFLSSVFQLLAAKMIYGGHFEVIGGGKIVRQIYIHTVEFYYHEEENPEEDPNAVHDYIVYHRNALKGENKYPEYPKKVKTFPIGSLNAHQSGVDITFEGKNEHCTYRASALIRAFMVKEGWNEDSAFFDDFPNNKNKSDKVNRRSTYLYDYLFQNATLPITIFWRDTPLESNVSLVIPHKRENVYEYEEDPTTGKVKIEEGKPKKKKEDIEGKPGKTKEKKDERPWAFSKAK